MTLGCDAAGVDEDGNEVVVHSVVTSRRLARRRDAGPEALDPVRAAHGHVRRAGDRAAAQPRPQAARAVVRAGGVPADRVADRVPDALHPRGAAARRDRAGAGRRRRSGHRTDHARPRGGRARVGDVPLGGEALARAGARRGRGVRAGRTAPRARRRGGRDGRRRDLGSLPEVAQAGRHDRDLRRDERRRPARGPDPDLLPAAVGGRLHHGHARRARPARAPVRGARRATGDRIRAALGLARATPSRRSPAATCSASSC